MELHMFSEWAADDEWFAALRAFVGFDPAVYAAVVTQFFSFRERATTLLACVQYTTVNLREERGKKGYYILYE